MTSEEYITQNFGESWLKNDWSPGDVIYALEEYAKYCAEQAWAFAGVKTFNEWWAEFQRKEATE